MNTQTIFCLNIQYIVKHLKYVQYCGLMMWC